MIKMIDSFSDLSLNKAARIAGFLYLMNAVFAIIAMIADLGLIVPGDAATTATNIMASEGLYLVAFMSNAIMLISGFFLPLALYVVFKPVNKKYATLFVLLLLMTVPVMCFNLVNQYAAMLVLSGADYLTGFDAAQLQALMMLFLDLEEIGYSVAKIFFGLWLLPLGYLVYKSSHFPKFLGILLVIACFGYLIDFSAFFLFPSSYELISTVLMPTLFFELAFCFWLLLKGANVPEMES